MKQFSKLKQKLRSSDSANQHSPQPASVPSAASTSQITCRSCHQSTGSSLTVPIVGSPAIILSSTATTEPATVSSPSAEPENSIPSHECPDTTAPEELLHLQHCKSVKLRQMWRLVYCGLEKSKRQAKYKEDLSTVIETIDNLRGIVDKAVKYLGLEILANPMKEPGLNRQGIAYVLSRMEWYWNLAELVLLQENSSVSSAALRRNLEAQIIDFYKKLLLDAVKLDDWSGELNTIKDAERLIRKDIEQYDYQDIRLKLGKIEKSAVEQAESLETICKVLREEARLKEKNEQDDKDKEKDPKSRGDPLKELYEWILKSDTYQTFIDDPSSRGRTMLLCGIINELQKSLRPISFFLCQGNVKEEYLSSDIAVMRGLIYVLLEHQPSLILAIRPSYDKQNDRLFNSINSNPSLRDTILLLTNLIVELSNRDWPEIHQELADATGLISLDLEQEHESVDNLAKTKIFDYMQSHADDTFLWVVLRLVMEELVKFPMSLRALYEAMMDRITDSSEADRLKQILALMPKLVEPMAGYDEDDVRDAIASCGSLLTLQNGEIFFVLFPRGRSYQHAHVFSRSVAAMENTLRQDIYKLGSPGAHNLAEVPSLDLLASIRYSCVDMQMQEITDFVRDARLFIFHHNPAIKTAALQVYYSALIFSPKSSVIRQQFSY
ncbi:hypothetical protein DER44DRAFT_815463 [Fusarium oxysporum]|nr:hypothetical protein DER44DRAFT_815463 [Fusarium oxysporum]